MKKVKGKHYAYLQESYREGGSVRTRTIDYFGAVEASVASEIQQVRSDGDEASAVALRMKLKRQKKSIDQPAQSSKDTPDQTSNKATGLVQKEIGDEQVTVNVETGEIVHAQRSVITTEKLKNNLAFSQTFKTPKNLDQYGVSQTALKQTHMRFGKRLAEQGIDPALMPKVEIRYGHPDRLKQNRDGTYTVFISRRTQNRKHVVAKSKMWKNYRQALSASYLEAIKAGNPELATAMQAGLDHQHKQAKSAIMDFYKHTESPMTRLVLSLQLTIWDKMPRKMSQRTDPADFGQIDFSSVNDWQAETINILAEVQKSGWQGIHERQDKVRRKLKSQITRKRNDINALSFGDKLSGKRRKLIREIMKLETKRKAVETLDNRLMILQSTLNF